MPLHWSTPAFRVDPVFRLQKNIGIQYRPWSMQVAGLKEQPLTEYLFELSKLVDKEGRISQNEYEELVKVTENLLATFSSMEIRSDLTKRELSARMVGLRNMVNRLGRLRVRETPLHRELQRSFELITAPELWEKLITFEEGSKYFKKLLTARKTFYSTGMKHNFEEYLREAQGWVETARFLNESGKDEEIQAIEVSLGQLEVLAEFENWERLALEESFVKEFSLGT